MNDVMNLGLNDWVTCPFDPVHRMKYSRFYNHFVECRKKHPDDRRKQCPYNFSEMIEPEHYEKHVSECPYRSLYVNIGQYTQLPEYKAPSHFDLIDEPQEPMRKKRHTALNRFDDSDEEFDSVSMADSGAIGSYLPRRDLAHYDPPTNPVSVAGGSDSSTERRGFGRGAWIRQMMEQKNGAPAAASHSSSVLSDESLASRYESGGGIAAPRVASNSVLSNGSPRNRYESSSDVSNDEELAQLIDEYRNDPFKITKDYGRGRGAMFRTLIHD